MNLIICSILFSFFQQRRSSQWKIFRKNLCRHQCAMIFRSEMKCHKITWYRTRVCELNIFRNREFLLWWSAWSSTGFNYFLNIASCMCDSVLKKINITFKATVARNHNYIFGSLAAKAFQIIALKLLLWIINNHVVSLVCSWSWDWRWKLKWITWKVWVSKMRTPLCSTIKHRTLQDSTQMFNDYSRPC